VPRAFLQPFPATGVKYEIPGPTGAGRPMWNSTGDDIMVGTAITRDAIIPVSTAPRLTFGRAEQFFSGGRVGGGPNVRRNYDRVADGRVLGVIPVGANQVAGAPQLRVVLNWFDELRRLVPAP